MEALSTFCLFLGGFLLAISLPPGAKATTCPGGWRQFNGFCYGFFNLKVSWMKAELECQSIKFNCHLASIVNEEETELLSKYLDEVYALRSSVWIGMHENKIGTIEKRHFEWTDRTAIDYTSWRPGEPHHLKKHCAALGKPGSLNRFFALTSAVISAEDQWQQRNTKNMITNSGLPDGVTMIFPTCVNFNYDV